MGCQSLLKPIAFRKLKSGKYIVLADNTDPLVIDEALAKSLIQGEHSLEGYNEEFISILRESGFFIESSNYIQAVPNERNDFMWHIMRRVLFFIGILSFSVILFTIPFIGIPIGNKIISSKVSIWVLSFFILIFSVITTLQHELMHIVYARTWMYKSKGLHLVVKKATAVVSMTHIWVWSFWSRLAAISAGIIFDLLLLAIFSCAQLFYNNWIIVTAASILWIRILWQFRFHKNCDGQLIAMTILDNPMVDIDANNVENNNTLKDKDIQLWRRLKKIGYLIDLILLMFWVIPFLENIIYYVMETYFI